MPVPSSRLSPRSFLAALDPTRWLGGAYLSGCTRVGRGVRVLGRPLIVNEGRIEVGAGATLRSLGGPLRLVARPTGSIFIEEQAVIDVGAHIYAEKTVTIGKGAVIGAHVVISDRDEHGGVGDVVIEAGARIEARARVVGPCRIGRGARVLPGVTVYGDVPAGAVVGECAAAADHVGSANGANGHAKKGAAVSAAVTSAATAPASPAFPTNGLHAEPKPAAVVTRRVSAVLAGDSTLGELVEHLGQPTEDGLLIESEVAPFDQVVQTLMDLGTRDRKVTLLVVWTRPEQVSPSFNDVLVGGDLDLGRLEAEVDAFASLLQTHADAARFVFVPSWVTPPWRRGMGMLELRPGRAANALMRMNLRLADALARLPNVFLLDAQRWLAAAPDGAFDPKLWHAGKVAFADDVLAEAAADIQAALRGVLGMSRKLVVVDLDDTMWGGIVGDVGWESLRLGGHDADGEAFVQFQKQLLALTKRGVALAVVSKNEEPTALDAMQRHPEMIIRPAMLAAHRINWRDKAQNILEIAQELNLGLQSVVFLDDNPIERGRVHEALPEVYVPEWPADPTHYPRALESLRCFDTPHVSAEDLERNAMYATERERTALRTKVSSLDDWLATLDLAVRFERLGGENVSRATQLLNKTNQLNLRTRRMSERELLDWSKEEGHEVWAVHVGDRFGQAGLTGLLGLARDGDDVQLADYVLSCRVMGRRVEESMVWAAQVRAGRLGGRRLVIEPIPTAKNKPCIDFFARLGAGAAERYVRSAEEPGPPPALVQLEGLS
jgi:FkbH-like protein